MSARASLRPKKENRLRPPLAVPMQRTLHYWAPPSEVLHLPCKNLRYCLACEKFIKKGSSRWMAKGACFCTIQCREAAIRRLVQEGPASTLVATAIPAAAATSASPSVDVPEQKKKVKTDEPRDEIITTLFSLPPRTTKPVHGTEDNAHQSSPKTVLSLPQPLPRVPRVPRESPTRAGKSIQRAVGITDGFLERVERSRSARHSHSAGDAVLSPALLPCSEALAVTAQRADLQRRISGEQRHEAESEKARESQDAYEISGVGAGGGGGFFGTVGPYF